MKTSILISWSILILTTSNLLNAIRIDLEENLPNKCNFDKCPRECWEKKKLIVHLVPHTHDDVGWLKTVDQYYYGTKQWIQNAGVQYILDTVVDELIHNKQRKFIYVETAFFWKWWQEQDEQMRSIVKELVRTGQLEFVNGGWSMPDEATTHYQSLIDQSTWGLRRLNDTFGHCGRPRVTWQIDPFGHSRELASLYALMGYDAVYFAREDYQDREFREMHRTLEHVWHGSDELGDKANIFAGMMQMGYGPPKGLDWDLVGGQDDPIVDNVNSEEYNVPEIIGKFRMLAKKYSYYYATNHIMFPMGTDFNYQSAHQWYKNMDKLIQIINNQNSNIRVVYSTPSCYTKALWNTNRTWTTKSDDYFPYASDPHAYWTGYYTSRPALKRMERVGNNWLQACKQLDALVDNQGRFDSNITQLREAMGVMQHHDAVAGTEKQHVANDYARMLHSAIVQCQNVIRESFTKLAKNLGRQFYSNTQGPLEFCNNLNISSCQLTESGNSFILTIYNPLAHELIGHRIRLPVNDKYFYQVYDSYGRSIPAVLVPIPDWIRDIPERPKRPNSNLEIVFKVNLQGLDIQTFTIRSSSKMASDSALLLQAQSISDPITLKGYGMNLIFDEIGQVSGFVRDIDQTTTLKNNFRYYESAAGDNLVRTNRSSGAYIFRPREQKTKSYGHIVEALLYNDTLFGIVQEVHQRFDSNVGQIIRMTTDSKYAEFDFVVGPISIADNIGKEIVVQYNSTQVTEGKFFTDSNGRQLIERQWNYRPTWPYSIEEPIAGNYYPVNSRIVLFGCSYPFAVLTDRSEGGTSPQDGMIELMVHRRMLHDDGFGVDEALNETGYDGNGLVIRCRHRLIRFDDEEVTRSLAKEFHQEPIMAFSRIDSIDDNRFSVDRYILNQYSLLQQASLPDGIHLLTLEQWTSDRLLMRLENFSSKNGSVEIDMRILFKAFAIIDYEEMTLAANQHLDHMIKNRLRFNYLSENNNQSNRIIESNSSTKSNYNKDKMIISIAPMEIRTFLIRIARR